MNISKVDSFFDVSADGAPGGDTQSRDIATSTLKTLAIFSVSRPIHSPERLIETERFVSTAFHSAKS
jgi:hypothetical protein